MHVSLILCALGVACFVRLSLPHLLDRSNSDWSKRWQYILGLFLFSPVLLLMTALAVLDMGKEGRMLGLPVGEIGFSCALGFLAVAIGCLLWRLGLARRSVQRVRRYPTVYLQGTTGYLLDTDLPFAAQIGIWQPDLVVSQGLLTHLSSEHIAAVLMHEQAHAYYQDTFWFFWLGWLRQLTQWLPHTERLWQELLLLREMRADLWAAERVDALLIAESLLQMTQLPATDLEHACAAIGNSSSLTRVEERIEALLSVSKATEQTAEMGGSCASAHSFPWIWLLLALMPLTTVGLHH